MYDNLKKQYNKLLARVMKGQKCCEGLDLTKEKDRINKERYLEKIIELLEEANKILLDLEDLGIKVTKKEINEGFKI